MKVIWQRPSPLKISYCTLYLLPVTRNDPKPDFYQTLNTDSLYKTKMYSMPHYWPIYETQKKRIHAFK